MIALVLIFIYNWHLAFSFFADVDIVVNSTREAVIAAAKLARCDEFIERLPMGYDTIISDNGKTLSGGERQWLSIARAFLKDAPVILLDERCDAAYRERNTVLFKRVSLYCEAFVQH